MNTSPSPFSAHNDVLEAVIPDDGEKGKRQSLLEECKRRAKSAVQSKCWPDAAALYDKALLCCNSKDSKDAEECAILNANLSLVHGKMNHWQKALDCAELSTIQNPLYVKAWWRLGQAQAAMQLHDKAVTSLQQALTLEPTNKALEKELAKQQQNLTLEKEKEKDTATSTASSNKTTKTTTTTTVTKTESSSSTTTSSTTTSNMPVYMDIDKDVTFKKSEPVKGYKIVNGKKTTYFHNELTEEAKQLIGDIAPKKLDSSNVTSIDASSSTTTDTSAWNKAGTWEEKDVTKWAKDSLKQMLLEDPKHAVYTLPLSSPAPNATVTTTKVKIMSGGHASVATVRGKKRYLYDFAIKVDWKFQHDDNNITANGSIDFPDIAVTSDNGDDDDNGGVLEATHFAVAHVDDETLGPILQTFVHHDGWRTLIHTAIHDWVQLFKETY